MYDVRSLYVLQRVYRQALLLFNRPDPPSAIDLRGLSMPYDARSRGRGASSHHGNCPHPTAEPQCMRSTRYVQITGHGPVPHNTLPTQNTGTTVVQIAEILPALEAPPVLFNRNTLPGTSLPYTLPGIPHNGSMCVRVFHHHCVCVFSTRRHPAHPASMPIIHARDTTYTLCGHETTTEIQHCLAKVVRVPGPVIGPQPMTREYHSF